MGYFLVPDSAGKETYLRYSHNFTLKGKQRFLLAGEALPPIVIESPAGVVATLPLADSTFDLATLPDGYYVAKATDCLPMAFVVRNGSKPIRGPLVPLVQSNMLDEKNYKSQGVKWVPYSDPPPLPKGNGVAVRKQTGPFNWVNRNDIWTRPLTKSSGVWGALKQWREDEYGNIHIGYFQLYFRTSIQSTGSGNLRDGPYGRGGVGSPVCIRELPDGSLLVVAINAGIKRIWPDLRVETVWGLRLPDNSAVPMISKNSTLLTDVRLASIRSRYELVGDIEPNNPFSVAVDPTNADIIWIVNTDGQNVLKYSMSQHKTLAIVGSPTGVMGHSTSGVGTAVLLRRPSGNVFGPDGLLYVTQAWNHSISTINPATLEFKEVWRSKNNWDTHVSKLGGYGTSGTEFWGKDAVQLRPEWEIDGPTGVGSSHHPQQCDFTSDGKLIFGTDHTRCLNEFDPQTGIKKTIVQAPDGPYVEQSQRHTGWVSMAVNKNGVGPMKDLIAYCDWEIGSLRVFKRDGTIAFKPLADPVPANSGTVFGRNDRVWTPGYPWCVGWGKDRLLWGDAGSERVQEFSMRQPTDVDYPIPAITNGYKVWSLAPPGGGLSLAGIYDDIGFSQLGLPQFQDMQSWTDTKISDWVKKERADLSPADLADVVSYIRYSQQPAGVVAPPPPPPAPLEPKIKSFTVIPTGGGVGMQMTFAADVENAGTLYLNGVPTVFPYKTLMDKTRTYELRAGTATATVTVTVEVEAPPLPETSMGFTSVTLVTPDPVNTPTAPASGLKPVALSLHGAGGNESTWGDLYKGTCGPDLGGNDTPDQWWRVKKGGTGDNKIYIIPRDPHRVSTPATTDPETFWFGWGATTAGPVNPYTELRMLAILQWAKTTYPYLDWNYVSVGGNSMGACGGVFLGARHPEIFSTAGGSAPRWRAYGVAGWNSLYRNFKKWSTAQDTVASPIAMADGSDYETYGDVIAMISDVTKPMPFFRFSWAWDDGLGMGRVAQVEAINALRSAKRGFVCAWGGGGHSGAGTPLGLIDASYATVQFKLGAGYPVLSSSSLDADPTTAIAGGINLGFEWKNVIESVTGFSCELRQRTANCTVVVTPYSKVFLGRTPKTVSMVKDVWQTLSFTQGTTTLPPPVITSLTVDGVGANPPSADLRVTVTPGQVVTIAWTASADSFALNGQPEAVTGSKTWTAPASGEVMVAANADRADGQTVAKLIYFTVQASGPSVEEQLADHETRITALENA